MSHLWEFTKTLAAIAILFAIGWYSLKLWNESTADPDAAIQGASFNCRKALADLATGYSCRNSASCSMTSEEQAALTRLESSVNKYCD